MTKREIMPGDRVKVFDHRLFKDDVETPLSVTTKPATVLCRYGERDPRSGWIYEDLVQVQFDHREKPTVHFTRSARLIEETSCG